MEQSALAALHAERRAIDAEAAGLEAEVAQARTGTAALPAVDSGDLAVLARYLGQASRYRQDILRRQADCRRRIQAQQAKFAEAGRRVKLLEHLEQARLAGWRRAFDREMELSAHELHLARWNR